MIKLTQKPDIPESLQVADVRDSLARISDKVQSGEPLTDKDFSSGIWRKKDVRPVLWEHHNGKCCYCERKRDPKGEPDVEHFRPKTKTTEDGNPGYWWLAYDWSNLFFSCKACNQKKGTDFPLRNVRQRARTLEDDLSLEDPYLIHPIDENPECYIGYMWENPSPVEEVIPFGRDREGRGDRTIEILGLKRPELTVEQNRALLGLEGIVARYFGIKYFIDHAQGNPEMLADIEEEIREMTKSSNEFAAIKRAYFRDRKLSHLISLD